MEAKKRKWLALLTSGIILIIMLFLWITNKGQPQHMQGSLTDVLLILGVFAVAVLLLFIFFGEIFNKDGSLQKSQILLMVTAVIFIMQVTLAFATYSFKQLEFENNSLHMSKEIYAAMKSDILSDGLQMAEADVYDEISAIHIINRTNIILNSTIKEQIGQKITVDPLKSYRFPDGEFTVVMDISMEHQNSIILKILLDLLTVLVASIILSIELVIFMINFTEDKFSQQGQVMVEKSPKMVGYVRQLAFLFFFASSLAVTFIAIIARDLGGEFFGISGNMLAGIPQSAEFLLTCVAIFGTSMVIEKKGWKISYVGGLCIVALGTLLSAFAANIALFILSRAVVGLGYGFCWMTLRNFALFTAADNEKNNCFALLNSGIYAGIICGAALGSVLADIIGYGPVLLTASALTLVSAAAVLRLENATYQRPVVNKPLSQEISKQKDTSRQVLQAVLFVLLLIVPSCIIGSFLNYYLPIYFTDIGKTTSDIGRARLIYGLIMVYVGPFIVRLLNLYPNLFIWNIVYNITFSLALIYFGLTGGFVSAMLVVLFFGLADSFGFVAQNNYFLNLEHVKKMGESKALSLVSFIKKQAEMLGPIAFGLTFMVGSFHGVLIMGIIFLILALFYAAIQRNDSQNNSLGHTDISCS
ncbi:MFS transporter [Candidatus Contubernalis alkaliaceticus]|uniref:MFS transporter n=1 Tax=Candidatus Contubernalis alkaliaceticus TaxID=338645 RepID=UPI001F4C4461|nr:MFS transporter [Candidatus Contubernalis alkalaceticus]UNC93514.1 MFS transporter [Candidatus Contubernalis alkalaceticus]